MQKFIRGMQEFLIFKHYVQNFCKSICYYETEYLQRELSYVGKLVHHEEMKKNQNYDTVIISFHRQNILIKCSVRSTLSCLLSLHFNIAAERKYFKRHSYVKTR